MKKIICSVLTFVLILLMPACGGPEKDRTVTERVYVEGGVFGLETGKKLPLDLKFSVDWLTKGDNTVFNGDLAAFSAVVSQDTYFREKDLAKGTQNRVLYEGETEEEYGFTSLLEKFGFTETRHVETFKEKEYAADTDDSATMNLGHMKADGKYDVFVVALRGCFSAGEWLSVFDPGADTVEYAAITGEHPEWTDKRRHKGVAVAASRATEFIDDFIAENDDNDCPDVILVTGHSRGGMLANIIGADLEMNTDAKTFTYTFNAMGVTTDAGAKNCKTVFNIFDEADFYTDAMPFGEECFFRYGQDISLNIAENETVFRLSSELLGRDYVSVSGEKAETFKASVGKLFSGRAAVYSTRKMNAAFETAEEAESALAGLTEFTGSEKGLGLDAYVKFSEITQNGEGRFEFTMEYSGAAILAGFAKTLAYGAAAHDAFVEIFDAEQEASEIVDFFVENAADISGGHYLGNSYVIATNNNG